MQLYAIVIEDDPNLTSIFQTTLQQAGFETALDVNGNQYRSFLDRQPALVILDLHLPFAFGGDILRDIRGKCPAAVVVIVTADLVKARELAGSADHTLVKPVSVASLLKIAKSVKG